MKTFKLRYDNGKPRDDCEWESWTILAVFANDRSLDNTKADIVMLFTSRQTNFSVHDWVDRLDANIIGSENPIENIKTLLRDSMSAFSSWLLPDTCKNVDDAISFSCKYVESFSRLLEKEELNEKV